jgi:ribonuclease HI
MLDAGLDPLSDHVGLGFIARNHMGEVLFSRWLCDQRLKLAEEAECLAAWTGLKYTLSSWKGRVWLESDCLATIHHLKDQCKNRSTFSHTIEEAEEILKNFREVRISKCHRSANEVAHELCQFGRRELSNVLLMTSQPACRRL